MEEQRCSFKNPNHLTNLNDMRLSGLFCDVTIKVNDREFPAHKFILAANLKYFHSMFLHPFQESKQDVITMKDVEETDLEAVISYAYTGELVLTDSNALNLLKIANYLNEDIIKEACIEFLLKHLTETDACRAYQFASNIECLSLKNVAKSRILSNLGNCSYTEYLDLDIESLTDVLVGATFYSGASEQNLFEGITRWILHDVGSRQIFINDLLSLIDMTKLAADYLMEYLSEIMEDQGDIVKDIMHFYYETMSLMVICISGKRLHMEFYDYMKKKWRPSREITGWKLGTFVESWIMSDNKFYYIVHEHGKLRTSVFNFSNNKNTTLTYDYGLLRHTAMCACSRFLYFCGRLGRNNPSSDQVLRYDLQKNIFESLTPMGTKRRCAAATFYQGCLLVLGGFDGSSTINSVEMYDPNAKKWMAFPSMCVPRSSFDVAILDEKLYACGGIHDNSVEVYDPAINNWTQVASMNKKRSDFFVVAHGGNVLAIGKDYEKTIEVYDPSEDRWQIDHEMSSGLQEGRVFAGGLVSSRYAN